LDQAKPRGRILFGRQPTATETQLLPKHRAPSKHTQDNPELESIPRKFQKTQVGHSVFERATPA